MPRETRIGLFPRGSEPRWPLWVREAARVVLALGLYIGLLALPMAAELGHAYWSIVAKVVQPILGWTQHFEGLPPIDFQPPSNQHTHLALILALFLVSWGRPLRSRLKFFAVLACLAMLQDVASAFLSLRMHEAKMLYQERGWVMLLPWEYNTFQLIWYAVYALPLEAAPFLLLILTGAFNAGLKPGDLLPSSPPGSRASAPRFEISRLWMASPKKASGLAILVFLVLGVGCAVTWSILRERDPVHLHTHVLLGNLKFLEGRLPDAEGEYDHALKWGARDGEAQVRLAQIYSTRGDRSKAVRILRQAAFEVEDEKWRQQIQSSLESLDSADPSRIPSISAVAPAKVP